MLLLNVNRIKSTVTNTKIICVFAIINGSKHVPSKLQTYG